MTLLKSLSVIAILGIVGAAVFFTFFPKYAPQASMNLEETRTEAIQIARSYLEKMGYDAKKLDADANFRFDSSVALYLENKLGLQKARQVLEADTLSTHYWNIYFFDRGLAPSQMPYQYYAWLSPKGRILGFKHTMQDSVALPSLEESQAREIAVAFLGNQNVNLQRYTLESSTLTQHINRKDYSFNWTRTDSIFGMVPKIWVQVQGDRIGGFRQTLTEPEAFQKAVSETGTVVTYIITASSIATVLLLLFVIAIFLKKYHEGEVGTKTAILVFAFLFAIIFLEHVLRFSTIGFGTSAGDVNRFNMRIIVFFITVFIIQGLLAAMVFAAWSVGESSARRGWSAKLSAIDGLIHGKPFTLDLASAVVRGYGFGFMLLGVLFSALALISKFKNISIFTLGLGGTPESYFPSLSAVFLALRVAILSEVVFRFFFISWLREKTHKVWPGLLISSTVWTLLAFNLWDFPVGYVSFEILFPAYFIVSLILGWILVKFDLLSAIVTNFVMLAFSYAIPILVSSNAFFEFQSVFFLVVMAAPLVVAVIGFIVRQRFKFTLELTPTHIRRIGERERMAKELEIARTVQMSLLPKQNPFVEGYDIAGVCLPALEVGGDYYDFFQLASGKFGIAIGDVSGKGVPAAIYMTLTKGILQSHAGEAQSPKEVLFKLNRQMFMNIERNTFVSMFYAVLDMREHTIRFARAGHNPAILAHRSSQSNTLLEPRGIAIGLESGEKFYQYLEESELKLQSGDVLTFYTDGFTEASNGHGEEFEEERLIRIISENKDESANAIIRKVVQAVRKFVGNAPQHDDMTMVVIKVL